MIRSSPVVQATSTLVASPKDAFSSRASHGQRHYTSSGDLRPQTRPTTASTPLASPRREPPPRSRDQAVQTSQLQQSTPSPSKPRVVDAATQWSPALHRTSNFHHFHHLHTWHAREAQGACRLVGDSCSTDGREFVTNVGARRPSS